MWNWKEEEFSGEEPSEDGIIIHVDGDIWNINILFENKEIELHCRCFGPDWTKEFFEALKKLIKIDMHDPESLHDLNE